MKPLLLLLLFSLPFQEKDYTDITLYMVNACNCRIAFRAEGKPNTDWGVLPTTGGRDTIHMKLKKDFFGYTIECLNGVMNSHTPYDPDQVVLSTIDFSKRPCVLVQRRKLGYGNPQPSPLKLNTNGFKPGL